MKASTRPALEARHRASSPMNLLENATKSCYRVLPHARIALALSCMFAAAAEPLEAMRSGVYALHSMGKECKG
jgi:hypothetical protein